MTATLEAFNTSVVCPMEMTGTAVTPNNNERPLEEQEGVFNLPTYNTQVISTGTSTVRSEHHHFGTTWQERWTMSDDIQYDVLTGEPRNPRVDMTVVGTTSLGTQIDGFNTDFAQKAMGLGFRIILVGPEIGGSVPLSQSADNIHAILDKAEEQNRYNSRQIAVHGISRAAMIAFGINTYGPLHDRKIVYSDIVDPCLAHNIDFTDAHETLKYITRLPHAALYAGKQVVRVAVNPVKANKLRGTVQLGVEAAYQLVRTARPLFSGEAGVLADNMPEDTQMHVRLFNRSVANHREHYQQILAKYPGVAVEEAEGAHFSSTNPDTLKNVLGRLAALRNQLQDPNVTELDFTQIHLPKAA